MLINNMHVPLPIGNLRTNLHRLAWEENVLLAPASAECRVPVAASEPCAIITSLSIKLASRIPKCLGRQRNHTRSTFPARAVR